METNMLNVLDSEKVVLFAIGFSSKNMNMQVATRLTAPYFQGKLEKAVYIEYPKGMKESPTGLALLGMLDSAMSITELKVIESTDMIYVTKAASVAYSTSEFWELKGYKPSDVELEELTELYELILDSRKRIIDITGFTSTQMVWTIKIKK